MNGVLLTISQTLNENVISSALKTLGKLMPSAISLSEKSQPRVKYALELESAYMGLVSDLFIELLNN